MTFFQASIFVFIITLALIVSNIYRLKYGWQGGIIVFIICLLLELLFIIILISLRFFIEKRKYPSRPQCKNGKCNTMDFKLIAVEDSGRIFRCACGDKYIQFNGHFSELQDDGTVVPYKKLDFFGNWQDE